MNARRLFCWGCLWSLAAVMDAPSGENWPRFRGPNGSATDLEARVPAQWTKDHILWRVPLEEAGISSPCVWGDRIFLGGSKENGKIRVLICFDAKTGKRRWQHALELDSHKKHAKNGYATATPVCDGTHVFGTFTSPDAVKVLCLEMDGKLVWDRNVGTCRTQHGSGASPILWQDLVIVMNDQEQPNEPSFVVALEKSSGKEIWRAPRPEGKAAYSTPFILEGGKEDQLILSSMNGLASLDPKTGKNLWTCNSFDRRAVGSPFLAGGLVMATCGEGKKGHKLIAVRPEGRGDVTKTHLAWEESRMLPYCVTPLGTADHVYTVTDAGGIVRCLDARTGANLWTKRLDGDFSASPVRAGDQIFLVSESGHVIVFAAYPNEYRQLAHNKLDDSFLSTPALAGNRMYLRGERALWCIGQQSHP